MDAKASKEVKTCMNIYYVDYLGDLVKVVADTEEQALKLVPGQILMFRTVEEALQQGKKLDDEASKLMKGTDET